MDILSRIEKNELKEMLIKNWMTHDAMWLYHTMKECGTDTMNKINLAAVRSMAAIEIQRVKKALGMDKDKKINSLSELMQVIDGAFSLLKGEFMDFEYSPINGNGFRWKWNSCFAYNGIKGLGLLDEYICGILPRVESWLDALGIKYEMNPKVSKCIMHTTGRCEGEFIILFD